MNDNLKVDRRSFVSLAAALVFLRPDLKEKTNKLYMIVCDKTGNRLFPRKECGDTPPVLQVGQTLKFSTTWPIDRKMEIKADHIIIVDERGMSNIFSRKIDIDCKQSIHVSRGDIYKINATLNVMQG